VLLTLGLLTVVVAVALAFAVGANVQAAAAGSLVIAGSCVAILVFLTGGILGFVGVCMCCTVPSESGTKGLVVGALVCLIVAFVLGLFAGAVEATAQQNVRQQGGRGFGGVPRGPVNVRQQNPVATGIQLVGNLVGLAGQVLFILFLRGVAQFFRNDRLAQSAARYLIFLGSFIGGCFLFGILMGVFLAAGVAGGNAPPVAALAVAGVFAIAALVCAVVMLLWLLDLLKRTRITIAKAMAAA
jgi:hypothetical protein